MDFFGWLAVGVIGFIAFRIIYEAYLRTVEGHTKDAETCPRCKELYEKDPMERIGHKLACGTADDCKCEKEWCDCPQREITDKHEEN